MSKEKENRVFGLVSVIAKNSNWNADFNHSPKKYEDTFYASDRALKFAVRNLMEQMGKKVLIKKWIDGIKDGKNVSEFDVMTSKRLKEYLKEKYGREFKEMFWDFEDVRQFGMVYDGLGIHGPAQITHGIDMFKKGFTYDDELTGRMVFESKSDNTKETRGMASRQLLTEGHFIYDFSVNPKNVHYLQNIEGYEDCRYTEEDFEMLLEGLRYGPANVKSTQKLNCFTGLIMYVELVDNDKTLLANLQEKLELDGEKVNNRVEYDISELISYLESKQKRAGQDIYKKIKIMYEEFEIDLKGLELLNNSSFANIVEVESI